MSTIDPVGAAPEARRPAFLLLLCGASAAPIFWTGQIILSYAVTAFGCYPGDVPHANAPRSLSLLLIGFDAVAIAACIVGGAISLSAWFRSRGEEKGGLAMALYAGEGRVRFLALWGVLSSLWFFFAIMFNTIASVVVPLCGE